MQSTFNRNHLSTPNPNLPPLSRFKVTHASETSGQPPDRQPPDIQYTTTNGIVITKHTIKSADLMWRMSMLKLLDEKNETDTVMMQAPGAIKISTATARTLDLSKLVVAETRENIYKKSYKSSNKRNDSKRGKIVEDQRTAFAGKEIFHTMRYRALSMNELVQRISRAGGNNCDGLAKIACEKMRERGSNAWVMMIPGYHACAIIFPGMPPSGRLPDDLAELPEGTVIADPWANLVCEAKEYAEAYRGKMKKWAAEHKQVRMNDGTWVSPMDPKWLNKVNGKKCIVIDLRSELESVQENRKQEIFHLYRDSIDVLKGDGDEQPYLDEIATLLPCIEDAALKNEMLAFLRSRIAACIENSPGNKASLDEFLHMQYACRLMKMTCMARRIFDIGECAQWMEKIRAASSGIPAFTEDIVNIIANELVFKEASEATPDKQRLQKMLGDMHLKISAGIFQTLLISLVSASRFEQRDSTKIDNALLMTCELMTHIDEDKQNEVASCIALLVNTALSMAHGPNEKVNRAFADCIEKLSLSLDADDWTELQSRMLILADRHPSPDVALERLVKLELKLAMDKWFAPR